MSEASEELRAPEEPSTPDENKAPERAKASEQPNAPVQSGEGKEKQAEGPAAPALVSIEDFSRLDLRVARVIAAEAHPKADRLLKLQVDLGEERRQIVAGIAREYRPEDLIGRLIVVVVNLKPAVLRGEPSQGMLLAASAPSSGEGGPGRIAVLGPDREIPPGSKVS